MRILFWRKKKDRAPSMNIGPEPAPDYSIENIYYVDTRGGLKKAHLARFKSGMVAVVLNRGTRDEDWRATDDKTKQFLEPGLTISKSTWFYP